MAKDKGKKKKKTGGMPGNNKARVDYLISSGQVKQIEKLADQGVQEAVDFVKRREAARTKAK